MPTRSARATWQGDMQQGMGEVTTGKLKQPYTYKSRVDNADGTNAEELLGAAQASCYSMALAARLSANEIPVEDINTTAKVTLSVSGLGFKISRIHLSTTARVPGLTAEEFEQHAQIAKDNCPVAQALAAVPIDLKVTLLDDEPTEVA